jgi:LytS/YehU family sensor histidine kinase
MRADARPWAALAIVAACAWAYAGWTPWLARFLQLALAFGLADAARRIVGRSNAGLELPWAALVALGCAVLGAVGATWALRLANELASLANRPMGFDIGLATAFAAVLLIPDLVQREGRRRLERDKQLAELRLKALEAQIEPHFLYNTLANVQQLVRASPAEAERMLDTLIRYLKVVIPDVRNGRSTLGREIDRVEAYLDIMRMRMGERLRYRVEVSADLRALSVPPLALITLVENAVKHGLEREAAGGTVVVAARRDAGALHVTVRDDGAGFADEIGTGTGLQNLRDRIETLYGDRASLDLQHASPRGVEATMILPAA